MTSKDKWVWMPHPGHFVAAFDCRFHLNTYVNGYIVSTVGEWFPDAPVREILAQCEGITLSGRGDERQYDYMKKLGFSDLSPGYKYETMVFKARPSYEGSCPCCPYVVENSDVLDSHRYRTSAIAYDGHLKTCELWGSK